MAKYSRKSVKRPPAVFYPLARWIVRVYCRFFLGFRVEYASSVPKTGPVIVLGSHQGLLDAAFMAAAIKNRKLNFVTTERFFRNLWVGRLFRFFGVIPRIQFYPDPQSIAAILRVCKNSGAVGIFPAGQTSMCGVPGNMPPSIARLVKKSNATVVALNLHGGFFTKSRFSAAPPMRGRVNGKVSVLFTPEELARATEDEIFGAVCKALDYNEYEWQQRTGTHFHAPARAQGYEKQLYLCPRCGEKYAMQSRGHHFFCASCGNGAAVGPDMRMTPLDSGCKVYPTMLEWFGVQEAEIRAAIDDESRPFLLETAASVQLYDGASRYDAGEGKLFLDREGIRFQGRLNGREVSLSVRHATLFGMTAETGVYIELYDPVHGLVRYLPRNPLVITEWKIAQEYLYAKTLG